VLHQNLVRRIRIRVIHSNLARRVRLNLGFQGPHCLDPLILQNLDCRPGMYLLVLQQGHSNPGFRTLEHPTLRCRGHSCLQNLDRYRGQNRDPMAHQNLDRLTLQIRDLVHRSPARLSLT
jgi:hypothetical protein